ncbi:hypothetical protein NVIE_1626 [Nitrososphaera viennensis EN76]|uniref:Uncharacterized protein n=1 Tax=Nitrososphaera viennensis EN76 TaxID=926571 RepID=A0A060HGX5_9ARCH|nr:hypothetical protein NVIE_1626 [Nitrososphaera viennensis EN76]
MHHIHFAKLGHEVLSLVDIAGEKSHKWNYGQLCIIITAAQRTVHESAKWNIFIYTNFFKNYDIYL